MVLEKPGGEESIPAKRVTPGMVPPIQAAGKLN
jgi:hypothetical protein